MTSAARLAANRQNAQKSTGPRTPEGKARASRNARKHGLAAAAREPDRFEKITMLAAALAEDSTDWDVRAYAHSVADAQLDLERVREARLLEHEAAGPGFSNKEHTPAGWVLRLSRLERYERRAFSRRKRAIRRLEAAKAGPRPGSALVELGRRVAAEFWQSEASGTAGEVWRNEPTDARSGIPQNEASGAGCDTSGETWQDEPIEALAASWQDEPTEAESGISQNEAIEASDGNQQIEATGAFNENWRNEPTAPPAVGPNEATAPSAGQAPRQGVHPAHLQCDQILWRSGARRHGCRQPDRRGAETRNENCWREGGRLAGAPSARQA